MNLIVTFCTTVYLPYLRLLQFIERVLINCCVKLFRFDQEQAVEMQFLNVEIDEWEMAVDRLQLQEVIGRGAFGSVWRALLSEPDGKPGNRTVAVKCFTRKIL